MAPQPKTKKKADAVASKPVEDVDAVPFSNVYCNLEGLEASERLDIDRSLDTIEELNRLREIERARYSSLTDQQNEQHDAAVHSLIETLLSWTQRPLPAQSQPGAVLPDSLRMDIRDLDFAIEHDVFDHDEVSGLTERVEKGLLVEAGYTEDVDHVPKLYFEHETEQEILDEDLPGLNTAAVFTESEDVMSFSDMESQASVTAQRNITQQREESDLPEYEWQYQLNKYSFLERGSEEENGEEENGEEDDGNYNADDPEEEGNIASPQTLDRMSLLELAQHLKTAFPSTAVDMCYETLQSLEIKLDTDNNGLLFQAYVTLSAFKGQPASKTMGELGYVES